jgi:5-methylthioadenosine/S-adenosylhomocysteine deaminase
MPVIPYAKKQNVFDAKVIAAHCVHIDKGEIHTLKHHGAGVAHNPSSNMKLASGAAPVMQMLETGLNVGIGTDGPASNNDLDMFEEVRLASFLAKLRSGDPTSLPARTAVLMATRMGAQALHLGHITGSLQPGKRADLILVELDTLHNSPRFRRDPDGVYAQLTYAAKSTDVTDVMVNGRWLMRARQLETIDERALLEEASQVARRIDSFLIEREQSVLSKLIAIGGATQEESFEVQVKARVEEVEPIAAALDHSEIEVVYYRHYHEYDTYFVFEDESQGLVRHREDEFVNPHGKVEHVRARLTHIGQAHEREYPSKAMLSRSRYLAPAGQSLRFLREYFVPDSELFIEKDRRRWLVKYRNTEFYINLDTIEQPDLGHFLEVKSRTWSRTDAERKADLAVELSHRLGVAPGEMLAHDYVEIVRAPHRGPAARG